MLKLADVVLSYEEIWSRALKLASVVMESKDEPLIGVLANREQTAYLAILSVLAAGKGYVPLNPALPDARLHRIVIQAGLKTVIVGPGQSMRASALLKSCGVVHKLISLAEEPIECESRERIIIQPCEIAAATARESAPDSESAPAYVLFTSGSTGTPKGVTVTNSNLCAYLDNVCHHYGYAPEDCHSQIFELTFDLSVHDMMCAWTTGGSLTPIVGPDLLSPGRIVRREQISCWFSVPTHGVVLQRTGGLKPGLLRSLRVSLFCGEPLPNALAKQWQCAAPNSIVENLYGPTEATIAFTRYRWDSDASRSRYGLVPIGKAFSGLRTAVAEDHELSLCGEAKGELWLSGPQVTSGYLSSPEQTTEKFCEHVSMPGVRWYRTGDIVERGPDGELHFVGRVDDEIKFRGYRINLLEIEAALREAAETPLAVAVADPGPDHLVLGITGVVQAESTRREAILRSLARLLPHYMIPHRLVFVRSLPCNLTGKIDKTAVRSALGSSAEP
jgi:amino acid adenylation domain-containing protein